MDLYTCDGCTFTFEHRQNTDAAEAAELAHAMASPGCVDSPQVFRHLRLVTA